MDPQHPVSLFPINSSESEPVNTISSRRGSSATASQHRSNISLIVGAPNSAVHIAANAVTEPSRRVRSNWLSWLSSNWTRISRASRFLLMSSLTLVLLQVTTTIVILVASRGQDCDRPLRWFLILYIFRLAFSSPLIVYQNLHPRSRRRQNNTQNGENGDSDDDLRGRRASRAKGIIDLIAMLIFIIGNYMLFTSSTCQQTSPLLFYLSLTWIVFGYIVITIPMLLCLSVIGCLPCVLVAMRVLRVGEALGPTGAPDNVIDKIPIYKFKASGISQNEIGTQEHSSVDILVSSSHPASNSSPSTLSEGSDEPIPLPPSIPKKKRFLFGKRPEKNACTTDTASVIPPSLEIPDPEDANCSICLSDYVDGEDLRKLNCGHIFHQECVDAWLKLNSLCPLCKTNVVEVAK